VLYQERDNKEARAIDPVSAMHGTEVLWTPLEKVYHFLGEVVEVCFLGCLSPSALRHDLEILNPFALEGLFPIVVFVRERKVYHHPHLALV
jgi:hypothetical protein